jgi:hypothetical protein
MKEPLVKRRRPGPQTLPSRDELFREAFMRALEGCCSQFETSPFVNRRPNYYEGDAELLRARQLVRRAYRRRKGDRFPLG